MIINFFEKKFDKKKQKNIGARAWPCAYVYSSRSFSIRSITGYLGF